MQVMDGRLKAGYTPYADTPLVGAYRDSNHFCATKKKHSLPAVNHGEKALL
ncbi:hypothetical protein ACFSMW_03670 [Virgibacillus halophilus]|uniref:Uncharacterized protein n=1 Tax=Tigheibacillus halophilus TaxID=361280 RepID=A0ABU5CBW7_9BACI|nr:hypothetical protein [Virgibacillus halophilus]